MEVQGTSTLSEFEQCPNKHEIPKKAARLVEIFRQVAFRASVFINHQRVHHISALDADQPHDLGTPFLTREPSLHMVSEPCRTTDSTRPDDRKKKPIEFFCPGDLSYMYMVYTAVSVPSSHRSRLVSHFEVTVASSTKRGGISRKSQ